jgi:hypothetical protein
MSRLPIPAGFYRAGQPAETNIMSDDTDCLPEDLKRVPGLFRRWELPELLKPDRRYHLEDAGTHTDGTPLLAVYATEADQSCPMLRASCSDARDAATPSFPPSAPITEQFIGQRELACRWGISPRTLERWRRLGQGPNFLKLRTRVVYDLRHVRAFEAKHLQVPQRDPAFSSKGERA